MYQSHREQPEALCQLHRRLHGHRPQAVGERVCLQLFDELLNIGAVVSGKVFSIGSDNLDSQTRKSVMSTIELYSEATKKMEENTAWLGSVFEANEKTVQPPSQDAKMCAKTSEMIEYFKFVLARFNALLPKLESPSAVRPKEEVPLPSL